MSVAHQHARQQARLAQDLEAVADAEDEAAALGVALDRAHDRRTRRDRPAAQIVAIGEAAGQDDEVDAVGQIRLGVPDDGGGVAGEVAERAGGVAFAIGAGEEDDGGFHRRAQAISIA